MLPEPIRRLYDTYYPIGTAARVILEKHSRSVAVLALEINAKKRLGIDPERVLYAALLHDIGVFLTDAPSIGCYGSQRYIRHGILGGRLLRREGFAEEYARVSERHTGVGITAEDIEAQGLPLPTDIVLTPETLLERLICYADKFYSKSGAMKKKSIEQIEAKLPVGSVNRWRSLNAEFGARD